MIDPIYYNEYSYHVHKSSEKLIPNKNIKSDEKVSSNEKQIPIQYDISNTIIESSNQNGSEININHPFTQYVLNPLSVIIKLSILSCKPIGTKINIQNNIIYLNEPGIFQSLTRYIFNSNKSHLQYLYNPIKIACKTYLTREFIKTIPNIINLFISAKNGVENLIQTYSSCPITVLCLKYYHVIILNFIKQTTTVSLFEDSLIIENDINHLYTSDFLDHLKDQWNSSKLKIVLDLMEFLLADNINKINNIKSLETIIQNIDEETHCIISARSVVL
jgi:hypothetical protein